MRPVVCLSTAEIGSTNLRRLLSVPCNTGGSRCIFVSTETVGETTVSSGRWGEDGDYELADAVHSLVASSALTFPLLLFFIRNNQFG
jgi:hypothetical protein